MQDVAVSGATALRIGSIEFAICAAIFAGDTGLFALFFV
jgi:hypothetical protein